MKKRDDFFLLYLFIYSLGDFCVLNYLPINQTGDKMCNKPRELLTHATKVEIRHALYPMQDKIGRSSTTFAVLEFPTSNLLSLSLSSIASSQRVSQSNIQTLICKKKKSLQYLASVQFHQGLQELSNVFYSRVYFSVSFCSQIQACIIFHAFTLV